MDDDLQKRVRVALTCRDTDYIPKVPNAGEVMLEEITAGSFQVMHNGLKVYTNSHYGEFNTLVIQGLRGHHEPREEKVCYEVLKQLPENATMFGTGFVLGLLLHVVSLFRQRSAQLHGGTHGRDAASWGGYFRAEWTQWGPVYASVRGAGESGAHPVLA